MRAVAFANVALALRPGGRLVFVCWQNLLDNEWITVPGAAVARTPYLGAEWAWLSVPCATWPVKDADQYTGVSGWSVGDGQAHRAHLGEHAEVIGDDPDVRHATVHGGQDVGDPDDDLAPRARHRSER